ncbi:hypothetical protein CHUAL_009891 [Chamberlinius hualienensis]
MKFIVSFTIVLLVCRRGAANFGHIQWDELGHKFSGLEAHCVQQDCSYFLPDEDACNAVDVANTTANGLNQLLNIIFNSFSSCQEDHFICGQRFNTFAINEYVEGACITGFCFDGKVEIAYAGNMYLVENSLRVNPVFNCSDLVMQFTVLFPLIIFDGTIVINVMKETEVIRLRRHVQISFTDILIIPELTLTPDQNNRYRISDHELVVGPEFTVTLIPVPVRLTSAEVRVQLQSVDYIDLANSLMLLIKNVVASYFEIC